MNPDLPPTPAARPSGLYIRLADAIVAVGALIILLFSWAPMVSVDDAFARAFGEKLTIHASLYSWLAPLGLFVLLAVLLLLASAVLDTFWHRDKQLVGLHRHHVQVGLALFVLIVVFGMMLADPSTVDGSSSGVFGVGYGGVIMFLGALIATAGAVLNHFNILQGPLSLPQSAPAVSYPPAAGPGYAPPTQAVTQADVPTTSDDPTAH